MRARGAALALLSTMIFAPAYPGEVPDSVVVLEVAPDTPGSGPEGAPPRFVLLKDGQAFLGGTSRIETVRLEKAEAQAIRRRVDAARKALGRPEPGRRVSLGEGRTVRLAFGTDPPVEVTLDRDVSPAQPGQPPEPVSALVSELLAFYHPSLRPYVPTSYALSLHAGALPGGCRRWNFSFPLGAAGGATRVVSAAEARGWPTGALPASVCGEGDKRYVLTLRPLLPGELP